MIFRAEVFDRLVGATLQDVIGLIERIYDPDVSPALWLDAVVKSAAQVLDFGDGVEGYHVTVGPHGATAEEFAAFPGDVAAARARFEQWRQGTSSEYQEFVHRLVPCGFGSELPLEVLGRSAAHVLAPIGQTDVFGVNGLDASGRGCVVVAFASKRRGGAGPSIPVWTRLAVHLATGARLVRRRAVREAVAEEAVLDPGGRVLHAEGRARSESARGALRRLAVDVDRARSASRRDPEQATQLWRALAAGRWSLVDRFDRDGRHFLVANPNEVEVPTRSPLTRREEQVVGYAALGHADKLIAYEMGLSAGTVATLLSRARRKLGVASRAELVARWLERRGLAP